MGRRVFFNRLIPALIALPLAARHRHGVILLACVLIALVTPAKADDRDTCLERNGAHSIEACTRLIATSQTKGTR